MNEQRLIDLETKVAYQEVAIDELQQVVYEQHVMIEKLEKSLKKLTERMDSLMGSKIGPGNERPPHY